MRELDPRIVAIARDVRACGARALLVGGYVRDRLLGARSKDIDVEIFGLGLAELKTLLARHGDVVEVGRAFGVLRVKGLDVDFALPRGDSRPSDDGDIVVTTDPDLTLEDAARRRDLTINAIALDPLSEEILDPFAGRRDLAERRLRATDPRYFGDDPLRGVRVAQLAARLEMRPEPALIQLCRTLDLTHVAPERLFAELRKLLLLARRPSIGLEVLRECDLLRWFPEVDALIGAPHDSNGRSPDAVWTHTLATIDEAAKLRASNEDDLALMMAALCHAFGTPRDDASARAADSATLAAAFLNRLRAPQALTESVCALVAYHLAPSELVSSGAGAEAYRTLARTLQSAGTHVQMLQRVARSHHLGQASGQTGRGDFPAGDRFIQTARALGVERGARPDAVLGRHLIARGLAPGPKFAELIARCRALQDETGREDPQWLLDAVLGCASK